MNYLELVDLFSTEINTPEDNTEAYWYKSEDGDIHYSEKGDGPNPNNWTGGGYSSDGATCYFERVDYAIVTMGDGCGGEYQAFFALDKQIDPEDYE